ncbi:hypothetical protein M072_2423 [Bacteroides fragilis str. DS-208]|nr:hypothetical protein M072_2423 [Bacteroides fragilis str. DS-208]
MRLKAFGVLLSPNACHPVTGKGKAPIVMTDWQRHLLLWDYGNNT